MVSTYQWHIFKFKQSLPKSQNQCQKTKHKLNLFEVFSSTKQTKTRPPHVMQAALGDKQFTVLTPSCRSLSGKLWKFLKVQNVTNAFKSMLEVKLKLISCSSASRPNLFLPYHKIRRYNRKGYSRFIQNNFSYKGNISNKYIFKYDICVVEKIKACFKMKILCSFHVLSVELLNSLNSQLQILQIRDNLENIFK